MALRGSLVIRKRLPRLPIQVHSAIVQFLTVQSADFFSEGPGMEKRLLFVNSLLESGFVLRGASAFDIFWRGVSPVETETGEPRVSGRRIEPSIVFLIAD